FSDPFVVVGINDLNVDDDVVTVFPNPSNGLFNIQFTKTVKGAADVSISNTIGQVVYKTTVVSPAGQIVQIDNDLAKGTYFVTIQTINEVKQIPLVIH
ncbi:MAG TPA: T9SS type A sorting domain-containing protein, partial [Bacteroidia bacterium]|nr:T9SS type A sorting domain-containing protein [Bacteroidia bacterium]HNU33725.1 T9SS type A sorting domain-containing protein [Bacteroidia bacterium]